MSAEEQGSTDGQLGVFLVSPSGQINLLTPPSDASGFHSSLNATFSPDLKKIAFVTVKDNQTVIAMMDANGSNKHVISHSPGPKLMPSWSPDGKNILYVLSTKDGGVVDIDLSSGKETVIPTSAIAPQTPAWFSDGSGFSFVNIEGNLDTGFHYHLEVFKNNTSSEIKISYKGSLIDDFYNPVFSPDGKNIVFSRAADLQLYIADSDGKNVRILTTPGTENANFSCPSWSPDGSYIVTQENDKTSNKESIAKIQQNGKLTRLSIAGFTRINCPRIARY
jgi:TolB protein